MNIGPVPYGKDKKTGYFQNLALKKEYCESMYIIK